MSRHRNVQTPPMHSASTAVREELASTDGCAALRSTAARIQPTQLLSSAFIRSISSLAYRKISTAVTHF